MTGDGGSLSGYFAWSVSAHYCDGSNGHENKSHIVVYSAMFDLVLDGW